MTTADLDRIASDHLMHSTAADYDINADFAADMRAERASAVADAIERDAAEQAKGNRVPWEPCKRQVMIDDGSAAEVADRKMSAFYEWKSRGLPDGVVEHDDADAGTWK